MISLMTERLTLSGGKFLLTFLASISIVLSALMCNFPMAVFRFRSSTDSIFRVFVGEAIFIFVGEKICFACKDFNAAAFPRNFTVLKFIHVEQRSYRFLCLLCMDAFPEEGKRVSRQWGFSLTPGACADGNIPF